MNYYSHPYFLSKTRLHKVNSTMQKSVIRCLKTILCGALVFSNLVSSKAFADVVLETNVRIADNGLYFDGQDLNYSNLNQANTGDVYDFFFGRSISAHGDAVKTYQHYIFMTWYRGGKEDRHVMLTRYNRLTGEQVDIEFPHRHTGFRGDPNIGESHNTIGLAVSPINGTIHMVYDMHAYDDNNHGGVFRDDFFRYSYSIAGAADVPDSDFTLDLFVKDTSSISQGDDDYKHLVMTGDLSDRDNFARLTYPKFFTTDDGTLILYMRLGGNNNGAYVYNRYDASTEKWTTFTPFNHNNQQSRGNPYNWGLYGNIKYLNGKLRIGFQQRSSDNNDKFKYQNGVYYAYSNHPEGFGDWFNHRDEPITWPLVNSDEVKVFEPGDYISHEQPNSVYIVRDFDWTVTARGDIHTISLVQTNTSSADAQEFGFADVPREKLYIHAYKPAGADEFVIDTDFVGASAIYTSGDNIYIIGLEDGRPYIEMAQGGTNSFSRVYEATNGPLFTHGTIYIKHGKVYYYLMERGSGNALPLHLQVFDLGISGVELAFEQAEMTLPLGYNALSISTIPSILESSRTIESVSLYIDDVLVSILDSAPFTWTNAEAQLENLTVGNYQLRAVATDSTNETTEVSSTLTIVDPTPSVSFPQDTFSFTEGYTSFSLNVSASTPIGTRTIDAVELYVNDNLIRSESAAPYQWGHNAEFNDELLNLPVGTHELRAVVRDSEGLTNEAIATLVIAEAIVAPTVTFSQVPSSIQEGYTSLNIQVDADSPMNSRTIANVRLTVNGTLVSELSSGPYQWTAAMSALSALSVGTHQLRAIATDSAGLTSAASAQLTVTARPTTTTPNPSGSSGGGSGGASSIAVLAFLLFCIGLRTRRTNMK